MVGMPRKCPRVSPRDIRTSQPDFCVNPRRSASPKPHPSKPHPCNMPQAKTEVALQFSECCAAEVALQHWLFCSADVILTKSCAAASEKLQCNIEKAALQESGAFLPLSCGFQAPTFRHPRLGPAEQVGKKNVRGANGTFPGVKWETSTGWLQSKYGGVLPNSFVCLFFSFQGIRTGSGTFHRIRET